MQQGVDDTEELKPVTPTNALCQLVLIDSAHPDVFINSCSAAELQHPSARSWDLGTSGKLPQEISTKPRA